MAYPSDFIIGYNFISAVMFEVETRLIELLMIKRHSLALYSKHIPISI